MGIPLRRRLALSNRDHAGYTAPHGPTREASAADVVATDTASVDTDCDNGRRGLLCPGMRRPDADRRGALVARETCEEANSSYSLQVGRRLVGVPFRAAAERDRLTGAVGR